MLGKLAAVGSIQIPSGSLEFGNLGSTDCVFLRLRREDDGVLHVVYTAEELGHLLAVLRFAKTLSQTSVPGAIINLCAMRPKPSTLRAALVHPSSGDPFVLMSLVKGYSSVDFPLHIGPAIELFTQGQIPNPFPPVCGMLRKTDSGYWQISGLELQVVKGQSPGVGHFGEFIHPDEARDGEELVVWPYEVEGRKFVGAFRTIEQWTPPSEVEEPMAQEGDMAWYHGETYRARQIHKTFAQGVAQKGQPLGDTWAAKLALTSLLCDISEGQDEAGHAKWVGHADDPVIKTGIAALEAGKTSTQDQLLYQQISCYYHSLGADQAAATRTVNESMTRLFNTISDSNPQQRRLLLGNWAVFLKQIYDGKPPLDSGDEWKKCKEKYPGRIVPTILSFPPPHPWVAAEDVPTRPISVVPQAAPVAASPLPPTEGVTSEGLGEVAADEQVHATAEQDPVALEDDAVVTQPSSSRSHSGEGSGKKIAMAVAGLVCLVLVGVAVGNSSKDETPETTATQSPAATPLVVSTSSTPAPQASVAAPTSSPAPPLTTGSGVNPEALAGKVTIAALDYDSKYYVDRDVEGLTMLEYGQGWARYEKDGSQVFLGSQQDETVKSTRAKSFAGEALYADGKKVLEAGVDTEALTPEVLARLKTLRLEPIIDESSNKVLGFLWTKGEDFPKTAIALGQPLGASLLRDFDARNLDAFRQSLTKENASLRYMDGENLFTKLARQAGAVEYCQALIDVGVELEGEAGSQPLSATADTRIAEMLLKNGVSPDALGPKGRSKLFEAPLKMTTVLLEAGANPNLQDEAGVTPLMVANSKDVVVALLKAGADPNLADKEGKTALMGADMELTKTLLAAGADPKKKDESGRTAADYAAGKPSLQALLKKAVPVKPSKTPAATSTPKDAETPTG